MRNSRSHFLQGTKSAGLAILLLGGLAIGADAQPTPLPNEQPAPLQTDRAPIDRPEQEAPAEGGTAPPALSLCQMIEAAAVGNGLPAAFFAQVIRQESRFKSDAVGPVTRSGQRAQGIAQFMPTTAAERRLDDPFDPVQALPKSAEFLRDLWNQFGNAGLAAAAYNAGPQRVRDWLAGKRTLPTETQNYVRRVTGRAVEEWTKAEQKPLAIGFPQDLPCAVTAGPLDAKLIDAKPIGTKPIATKPMSIAVAAKPPGAAMTVGTQPAPGWFVQLAGDRSEFKAMAAYFQLQKKHQAILGSLVPDLVRSTPRPGAAPVWSRVRVAAGNRLFADALCSKLRAAGESCLVQRN
jgi:hypothetical protein